MKKIKYFQRVIFLVLYLAVSHFGIQSSFADMLLGREAMEFPSNNYLSNKDIAENMNNNQKFPSSQVNKSFSSSDRVSNRDIIQQRKRQDDISIKEILGEHLGYSDDKIILTFSGISLKQSGKLMEILSREIGFIRSYDLLELDDILSIYVIELKRMNIKQFSETLDGYRAGSYTLDLIRFNGERVDLMVFE